MILYLGYRDLLRRYGRRQGKALRKTMVVAVTGEITVAVGIMAPFGVAKQNMLGWLGGNWFLIGLGGMGLAEMYVLKQAGRREARELEEGDV